MGRAGSAVSYGQQAGPWQGEVWARPAISNAGREYAGLATGSATHRAGNVGLAAGQAPGEQRTG